MNYKILGKTGIRVSSLCCGTMPYGGDADEKTSAAMFHRCREVGINFFDTADIYNHGRSEEILGRLIADCRDEIVLTSKVYGSTGTDINARGLSRRHIMTALEASLTRLGTDYLDLYFVHQFDTDTSLEVTLRALDDLVRQGKILHAGASNWAAWQIATALGISAREGLAPLVCLQPMYSLAKRQVEVEIFPLARAENLATIVYSPLGGGLLTAKYGTQRRPERGRLVENKSYEKRYELPAYFEVAERFTNYAAESGYHPASLALAWVAAHPDVTAPIIGARNLEQLEPSLQSLAITLSPEQRAEITALSIDPPLATDRDEERYSGPSMGGQGVESKE